MYPVVLGVRPEIVHATLGDRKVSTTLGVDAWISNGENRGPDLIVFYEYHDTQLIGRFLKISKKPSSGEQIRVWMDCAGCQSSANLPEIGYDRGKNPTRPLDNTDPGRAPVSHVAALFRGLALCG